MRGSTVYTRGEEWRLAEVCEGGAKDDRKLHIWENCLTQCVLRAWMEIQMGKEVG